MVSADIILDSINEAGHRLTTFKLRYPRFIHPQVLMHRAFSRSCSSSRAIPTQTMIGEVMKEPTFAVLGKNKAGMQPGDDLDESDLQEAMFILEEHRNFSVLCAMQLAKLNVHKQWANRVLETHAHISVVLTVTDHSGSMPNYLGLRCSKDAQEEHDWLGRVMKEAWEASTPKLLKRGEWHTPLVTVEESQTLPTLDLLKVSSARCARTSYNKHDNTNPVVAEDLVRANKLLACKHSNPFEHQARSEPDSEGFLCGNFVRGWHQNRKLLEQAGIL